MNPSPTALQAATSVVDRASAGENVEAYVQDVARTKIDVSAGEVESLNASHVKGVGVRVIADQRVGYAYTTDLTDDGLDEALGQARENASTSTPDDANQLPEPTTGSDASFFDPNAPAVPTKTKIDIALELESRILGSPQVSSTRSCTVTDATGQFAVASTTGLRSSWQVSTSHCVAVAIAGDGDNKQTGTGFAFSRNPEKLDIEGAASEAIDRAVRMLGAKKVATAKVPVIFDPHAAVALLAVVGAVASADAVIKQRSLLAGRMDEIVGSRLVTLVDDGLRPDGISSAPFDDEGRAHAPTTVIDQGVLRSYLYDSWSARRLGATSTGNAIRASFRTVPSIGPTNLCLVPGDRTPDELVSSVDNGFYVQDLIGVHSGVNSISGDFSVGAAGLWISSGRFAQPVREVTVASTVLDLLKGIVAVGSDQKMLPGFLTLGSYACPSIVIEGVMVAGS